MKRHICSCYDESVVPSREVLLAVLGAALTVGVLVVTVGAAAAVFLFFGTGLLLAALFGEAGPAPAPEGAVSESGGGAGEVTEPEPSGSDARYGARRSLALGSLLFYYVVGLCLCSVGALVAFAVA